MSDQYYIRIRGQVKGPLTRDQIMTQVRRKRLGRHHELSVDGIEWQKAGDMSEFFEPVQPSPGLDMGLQQDSTSTEIEDTTDSQTPADDEWYYTKGGNKIGPVTSSDLQMWLSTGRLSATDPVWNAEFDSWIPIGELPQFASKGAGNSSRSESGAVFPKASFIEVFLGTSQGATLPGDAVHKYPNLTRYLRIAESVLRVLFVLMLFLDLAAWFYFVGKSVHEARWELVFGGLIAGPLQVLTLWLIFITCMAGLEFIRVVINIEANTSQ